MKSVRMVAFLLLAVALVLPPCLGQVAMSNGTYFSHISFNNDVEEVGKLSCSMAEWTIISDGVNGKLPTSNINGFGYNAVSWPYKRKNKCDFSKKYGQDECAAENRSSRRNRHGRSLHLRGLQTDSDCAPLDTNRVKASLAALSPRLSPPCQALLATTMTVKCMQKVPCDITHFTLWNAKTDTIIEEVFESGDTVCGNATVSLEAATHFDVGKVTFAWTGPKGSNSTRTQFTSPYTMFGHLNGTNILGMNLPFGNFSVTATSVNNPAKAKTVTFRVIKC